MAIPHKFGALLLLATITVTCGGWAVAQETGDSTRHEHYGDPSEGHFGDPSAGHFGSPPRQRWSEFEPVTVRPLKPFDDRYAAAVAAKQQRQDAASESN